MSVSLLSQHVMMTGVLPALFPYLKSVLNIGCNTILLPLPEGTDRRFTLNDFGFMIFHSPYCKLVQKSVARLLLNDFLSDQNPETTTGVFSGLEPFR